MNFAKLPFFSLWIRSAAYSILMTFDITYILSKGMGLVATSGSASSVPVGILQCILACAVFCACTLVFMRRTPAAVFPLETVSYRAGIGAEIKAVLKLLAALAIFVLAFAVAAGLLALLIYKFIGIGMDGTVRKLPVTVAVYLLTLLSIPCFISLFANYASGERDFSLLLKSGVRMGTKLYAKYIILAAVTLGLAIGIRFLCEKLPLPADMIVTIILNAAILGVSIPLSWNLLARENSTTATLNSSKSATATLNSEKSTRSAISATENAEQNDSEVRIGA